MNIVSYSKIWSKWGKFKHQTQCWLICLVSLLFCLKLLDAFSFSWILIDCIYSWICWDVLLDHFAILPKGSYKIRAIYLSVRQSVHLSVYGSECRRHEGRYLKNVFEKYLFCSNNWVNGSNFDCIMLHFA